MSPTTSRRLVFYSLVLFTVAAYGACYFTIRRAIDLALVTVAGTWK